MLLHRCLHCLAAGACEVKFDKKGRPYTICRFCATRTFCHSLDALRGIAIVPQLVESALAQRASNPAFAQWFDGEITKTLAMVRDRALAPTPPNAGLSPAPSVVPFEEKKSA